MSGQEGFERRGLGESYSTMRLVAALVVALALAAASAYLAVGLSGQYRSFLVWPAAGLSFLGFFFLIGLLAGYVRLGGPPRQQMFFESLMDVIGEAMVVTDMRGRVIYINDGYRDLLEKAGAPRKFGIENLYTGFAEISEPIYRLAQAAREGRSATEELRLSAGSAAAGAKPDEAVWLRISVAKLGPQERRSYVMWRHRDITEERRQQELAFGRLQHIINYLDHCPAGFFSVNASGQLEYINATLANWLGVDLTRTSDGSLQLSDIASSKAVKLIISLAPSVAGERTRMEVLDIDFVKSNGEAFPVRLFHRVDYDENGQAMSSRSLVLDRRAEGAQGTADAEARLSRIFNEAPVGMAQLDGQGRIVGVNLAFLKMSPTARRGALLTSVIAPAQARSLERALQNIQSGEVSKLEASFVGESPRSVQMFISRDEEMQGSTVFAVDITEHRSLEVQLVQSQKMQAIGQLAGGVAHDFNNVLTAIIGFSDLLLARHRPADPAFQDIMNIKQNASRAANLVRQLLAFSRRQTLRPEILSLTDVLSDLGNLLGRLLGEKVELKVTHGRDLGLVKVDVNQFEQVIMNLAVNARDAMPEGGALSLRTANVSPEEASHILPGTMPAAEYVLCEVSDTGTGMSQEVLEKIYEPFFTTKEVGKGTGLGLSTVYGIIKQTGGFIFCDSELGRGTVFRIYLPRYTPQEGEMAQAQALAAPPEKQDLSGAGTILLVEDEDAVRSFASRALQTRGYKVLEASSGEAALDVLESSGEAVDLVLSDVVMPEMDGPSLLKELRRRGINTKVVFISGYAEDAFEKNLEGQSDFAFLPKPFTLKQLAEKVKEAMVEG